MKHSTSTTIAIVVVLAAFGSGCSSPAKQESSAASSSSNASAPAKGAPKIVKSRDGKFDGEVFGTAVPNSKFAKLQIGMEMNEVQELLGRAPDRTHTHETGKRWIPFYFGSDARRLQALYKGEGCLGFTGGNVWGSAGGELVQITHDASGACYQP